MSTKGERRPLTDALARAVAAPKEGYALIRDGGARAIPGFALRITAPSEPEPKGARSWVLNYRTKAGRERRMTIGGVASWPIKAARERASELRRMVDAGGDPLAEQQEAMAAPTIDDLADRFEAEHLPRLRPASREAAKIHLRMRIRPTLGKIKVADLTFADVDRLHQRVTKTGKRHTANRTLATLSKMLSLAVRWQMRADNPVKGVERNPEHPRQRYLTADELERLMAALAERKGGSADAVRLLLLTGARRGEVLGAAWEQFDLREGVWTKPSAHTKQKREHRVPLSAPARQLLADMWTREKAAAKAERRDPSAYLFPSRGREAAQAGIKKFWRGLTMAAGISGVRLHDLRHSYASSLAGAGFSLPVIGALLGHTQAQTTLRYSHLADAALRAATERAGAVVTAAAKAGEAGAEVHELPSRGRQ